MPRACDPCAVRKIKCNGKSPCAACIASSTDCSRVRKCAKPGPKGPRKRTEEAIRRIQQQRDIAPRSSPSDSSQTWPSSPESVGSQPQLKQVYGIRPIPWKIPIAVLEKYLDIYKSRLYAIWPVVNRDELVTRLYRGDSAAYALATAICAATIAQLHLFSANLVPLDESLAAESEKTRFRLDHLDDQLIDALLSCFFLHVFYANTNKLRKSTFLLREAITYAHISGLDRDALYAQLAPEAAQPTLRIAWLLFITDRAHSLQHDIPHTFRLSATLPALDANQDPDLLPAFCNLCKLFWLFDAVVEGHTPELSHDIASQLQEQYSTPSCGNEIQRADLLVTEPWLRVVLWKSALPFMDMTTEADGRGLSAFFPVSAARYLLSGLSTFALDTLEPHGPGMISKLFEVASSLADVIICMKNLPTRSIGLGPRDILHQLASLTISLRNANNPVLLSILQEKLRVCALDHPTPGPPLLTGCENGHVMGESTDGTEDESLYAASSGNVDEGVVLGTGPTDFLVAEEPFIDFFPLPSIEI